ncbi:MAG: hypothetical protein CM15mP127_15350 [Gammaproteobacteria bacterium]|nr:MAG: hypothetical protein CM15mP127_15350 [Gammaproteobacteria bacterium]
MPSSFVADGDLSEWFDSDIMPFMVNPETGYTVTGNFLVGMKI